MKPSVIQPAGARREELLLVAGTLGLALAGLLVLLGVSLPGVLLGVVLVGGATLAFLRPEIGLYALLLNALIGLSHMASLPRIGPLSVPVAFEGILLLAVAYRIVFMRHRLFIASPQHLLALALLAWMLLSLITNERLSMENLSAIRNLYLIRMLIFFLLTNILLSRDALRRMVIVFMLANAGLLLTSLLVRLGTFGLERLSFSERILRTSSILHNPNNLAFELTTMLIFTVAAFLCVSHPVLRGILAALAGADVLAILATLSRSGFLSLIVVLTFLLWKVRRDWRGVAVAAVLGLLIWLFIPPGLAFRLSLVEEIQDVDRLDYARVGMSMAAHNPVFGVGIGNYLEAFDEYNDTDLEEAHPSHNMYMSLAAQMGFPALILYLLMVTSLWARVARLEKDLRRTSRAGSFLHSFGWAVQVFLVNLLVFGLSGDVQFEYSVFAAMGFGMLLHREHQGGMAGVQSTAGS
jgi:hypothetical protein